MRVLLAIVLLIALPAAAQPVPDTAATDTTTAAADTGAVAGVDSVLVAPAEPSPENPIAGLVRVLENETARFQEAIGRQTAALRDALALRRMLVAVALLALAYFVIRLLGYGLNRLAEARPGWAGYLRRAGPFLRFLLWGVALWSVVGYLFGASSVLMTLLIVLTLAAGVYAAFPLLRDAFGGALLLWDRAFEIGSRIEVDGHTGTIAHIGLRSTRLTLDDGNRLVLPNTLLLRRSVVSTAASVRAARVEVALPLPAGVPAAEVVRTACDAATASTFAAPGYPAEARLTAGTVVVTAYAYDARHAEALAGDLHRLMRLPT